MLERRIFVGVIEGGGIQCIRFEAVHGMFTLSKLARPCHRVWHNHAVLWPNHLFSAATSFGQQRTDTFEMQE
jgi:hypothetical protein